MSEWKIVPAGTVATQRKDIVTLEPGVEYRTMGVRWYGKGAYDRGTGSTETIKAKRLFRAHEGDFVFNRIDTQNGAFDVVPVGLHGALATNEFPLYVADPERLLAKFLLLYFQQPSVLAQIDAVRAGSEGRSRWKESDFESWRIPLPPLAEQRRIVDIVAAVDTQISALSDELDRARSVLDRLNSDTMSTLPQTRPLGDFTTTRSGPSYAAADVSSTPLDGSTPVIGIPNTRPDGSIDLTKVGYVTGLPDTIGKIDETSLVLIRTNGNRQRIGNVYLPPSNAYGHAVSAFQFLMKVADGVDREFVYWVLREPTMQAAMSEAASGTTGLGNLAVRWLNSVHVPWSDNPTERAAVLAPLRGQHRAIDDLTAELSYLRAFRSALLTALLNQEIEIPESYDRLLEQVP
jgi:restriction endonuclease S subunit